MSDPTVSSLHIYPVKSCRSYPLDCAEIDNFGFSADRRFMLVDGSGDKITQREQPLLARVCAEILGNGDLRLSTEGLDKITIKPVDEEEGAKLLRARIWDDEVLVCDQGDEAANWFDKLIGHKSYNRLVKFAYKKIRPVRMDDQFPKVPNRAVALTDDGPLLLISKESLKDLNEHAIAALGESKNVPMDRFRPNIVVEGSTAFDEDSWLLVLIGETPCMAYKNAVRCNMPATDQMTGMVDKVGPTETLRRFRAPRGHKYPEFGQLLVPLQNGSIHVGDKITVLERKKFKKASL